MTELRFRSTEYGEGTIVAFRCPSKKIQDNSHMDAIVRRPGGSIEILEGMQWYPEPAVGIQFCTIHRPTLAETGASVQYPPPVLRIRPTGGKWVWFEKKMKEVRKKLKLAERLERDRYKFLNRIQQMCKTFERNAHRKIQKIEKGYEGQFRLDCHTKEVWTLLEELFASQEFGKPFRLNIDWMKGGKS